MKTLSSKHSMLFRIVTTVVFLLLLINTVALTYPNQDDPISQFLSTLGYIFFGTTNLSTTTSSSVPSDSTITGIDPSHDPPPPPPPK